MSSVAEYAEPRKVTNPDECFFYHAMDLPDLGSVEGIWDLRQTIDAYLGHFDFRGKRALDIGTASGYLTFEMEKRGAEVVSFDLSSTAQWDVVSYMAANFDIPEAIKTKRQNRERLVNSYWFAHARFGSQAKVHYGHVYDIPEALGTFDVVVLGAILLHLRDPVGALVSATQRSRDAVIITDIFFDSDLPVMKFLPNAATKTPADTWWHISEPCMVRILEMLGFEVQSVTRCEHFHQRSKRLLPFSTYVARRPDAP